MTPVSRGGEWDKAKGHPWPCLVFLPFLPHPRSRRPNNWGWGSHWGLLGYGGLLPLSSMGFFTRSSGRPIEKVLALFYTLTLKVKLCILPLAWAAHTDLLNWQWLPSACWERKPPFEPASMRKQLPVAFLKTACDGLISHWWQAQAEIRQTWRWSKDT